MNTTQKEPVMGILLIAAIILVGFVFHFGPIESRFLVETWTFHSH
jgi:hypothetical protein